MKDKFPNIPYGLKEHVLENVLQKTPFGFSLVNEDYIFEFANDEWLNIVQKKRADILGKKMFDVFPETKDQLLSIFDDVKINKQPFYSPEQSFKLKRAGVLQDVFFNFVYQPIYSDSGDLQYFAIVVIEVTDLVSIRNKIKNEEERLRLATESSHTATWDLNLKNSEIIYSTYLSEIFEYDEAAEITHQQLRNHVIEYDRVNIVEKAFEQALITGKYQYEARIIGKKGNLKWVSTNGKIFFDQDGTPSRMLGVMQDITERKKTRFC